MSGPSTFRALAGMSDRAVEAERLLAIRTAQLVSVEKRLREVEGKVMTERVAELEAHAVHLGKIAGEVAQWVEEGFVEFREDPLRDGLPLPDSDESLELVLAWFDELKEGS